MTFQIVHVVDDDELARKGTARLLAAAGFDARTYARALDFLTAIEPTWPAASSSTSVCPTRTAWSCQPLWRRAP
jgi:hypothetical protein